MAVGWYPCRSIVNCSLLRSRHANSIQWLDELRQARFSAELVPFRGEDLKKGRIADHTPGTRGALSPVGDMAVTRWTVAWPPGYVRCTMIACCGSISPNSGGRVSCPSPAFFYCTRVRGTNLSGKGRRRKRGRCPVSRAATEARPGLEYLGCEQHDRVRSAARRAGPSCGLSE